MLKAKDYVFVLWGDGFDEAVASIFVTQLRDAGLLVKVVGLTPRQISGSHGLALVPDLTLDQALPLATSATGLIIPATSRWRRSLDNDPRVYQLLEQANANQALFVLGSENDPLHKGSEWATISYEKIMIYPEAEDIVHFAREIAQHLSKKAVKGRD